MKLWSNGEEFLLKEYYLSGMKYKEIEKKLDRSRSSVFNKLKSSKYYRPKSKLDFTKFNTILDEVSLYSSLPKEVLNLKTRKRDILQYRQLCHFYAMSLTRASSDEIGKFFGNKDHATVLHSKKTILNLIETDSKFKDIHDEILINIKRNVSNSKKSKWYAVEKKNQIMLIKESMNINTKIEFNDFLNKIKNERPIC